MSARIPVEIFPPGEFLKDELEARNWSQIEFAEIIGKDTRLVWEVVNGKRSITPETAIVFGEALGTSAELWMNLESQYQLSKVRGKTSSVSQRAQLYGKFPIREMIKRGWIQETSNVEVLEKQVTGFFGISNIEEEPMLAHAAKKTSYKEVSISQLAWLFRVKKIAETMVVSKYSDKKLKEAISKLDELLLAPEETRHVAKILMECGVRFVVVENVPGAKIDGVCFWLNKNSPVIGMSLVKDRIDNFWFVVRHEIEHVLRGHGVDWPIIDESIGDDDLSRGDIPEEELVANSAASQFCVPQDKLSSFVARVAPYFYEAKVVAFAKTLNIHPGLVVGQLQRKLNDFKFLKRHQVKIRHIVISTANYDGWGYSYPVE